MKPAKSDSQRRTFPSESSARLELQYTHPPGVKLERSGTRPLLTTPQGGRVAIDAFLQRVWEFAGSRSLEEIIAQFLPEARNPSVLRAALSCLCEAGLLNRADAPPSQTDEQPQPASQLRQSPVSAIIVSYESRAWLADCLLSLAEQTLPLLETIVVDNGSSKDPGPWLAGRFPKVTFRRLARPLSLAAAMNTGIALASGEHFLLLNPDTLLDPNALAHMLAVARSDPACGAVAPLLKFSWAPAFLNGLGNYARAFSWGADYALGHLDLGQFRDVREVPSACFAAVLIPRAVWEKVGALDEAFPLYYEDIEWSYRCRLLGYRVLAAPQAVVYHAFGQRVHTGQDIDLTPAKLANVTFGRLRFASKILGGGKAVGWLASYALDDLARAALAGLAGKFGVLRAYARGWWRFWTSLRDIWEQRLALQTRRAVDDRRLMALQKTLPDTFIWQGLPELTWDLALSHYWPLIQSGRTRRLPESGVARPNLLIISNEIIDVKMAGPGMRYLEMARVLCKHSRVTLAVPGESTLDEPGVRFAVYSDARPNALKKLVNEQDVVLLTPLALNKFPFLSQVRARLVVDLYDPYVFENLFYYLDEPLDRQVAINRQAVDLLNRAAQTGDFFICGSERQRDLWTGLLLANQRINPRTFAQDRDLQRLIGVVGVGFPDREPIRRPFLRGSRPELPPGCRIVLWGGGLWDWLDPLTLVQAWPRILAGCPEARLVFLGTRHPNPEVPAHRVVAQVQALAGEMGERERTIFFIEWLAYEDREALLCEADVGVTLHPRHVETRYSIRTRVLDYLWARLPIVVSEGDVSSNWVREFGVGRVVPVHRPEAVAQAVLELLSQPKERWVNAFDQAHERFRWSQVVAPLAEYVLRGDFAADQAKGARRQVQKAFPVNAWRARFARARYIWRTQGAQAALARVGRNVRAWLAKLF